MSKEINCPRFFSASWNDKKQDSHDIKNERTRKYGFPTVNGQDYQNDWKTRVLSEYDGVNVCPPFF